MLWSLAGVVALGWFAVWIGTSNEKRSKRSGQQFARRNRALIDSEFVAAFDRATSRSRRLAAALWFAVFSTYLLLGQVIPGPSPSEAVEAALLGVAAAIWFSVRLFEAGREFPVPRGRQVVARPVRTVPGDYVAPATRLLTGLIAVLVGIFGVVVAQRWNGGDLRTSDAVVLLAGVTVTVGVAALAEVFARALCERPQRSVDACHLYFQDAWRGEALNHVHLAVTACGFLVVMGAYGSDLVLDWSKPYSTVAAVLAGLQVLFGARSQRRFRRTLWSGLGPSAILMPGDPAPPRVGARP